MKKTLLFLPVFLLLFFAISLSGDKIGPRPENLPFIVGNEPLPDVPYYPSQPGMITDSPGEIVGRTEYDYQSNGSTGRRIALDSQGGIHVDWMNGITYPSLRHVYYNYRDNNGTWLVPGVGSTVSQASGAGYTQLELTSDDRAVIAYHQWQVSPWAVVAIDAFSGFGIFNYYDPPDLTSGVRCYWPYISIDRNENIHLIVNEQALNAGDPHIMAYTMSTDNGDSWSILMEADTLMTLSAVAVSSPVSDKVAIAYTHPQNYETQWENDVYYIQSDDGLTWDWRFGKIDVTNYGAPDSLFAYIDIDAIYDYNDNLNLIWNAQWVTDAGVYYRTYLFHYSTGTQTITQMHETPELWPAGCDYGVWNRAVTKMSLAVHENSNTLFAVYTGFDSSDCSAGGYANGDIYWQFSSNGGVDWTARQNLTNSQSPGCTPGNCDSDHWSSVADKAGSWPSLHITYINDKDAGGIPQTEGSVTDNPVMYFTELTGVDEEGNIPKTFKLSQNYPNPFNASTQIEFELESAGEIDLSIYDVTGARITTLARGLIDSGIHSVKWDASEYSSGVYYYRLRMGYVSETRKMTLIK
ncbi:MAG: T9SS type A sorting domain-containing protein [Candidatus Zixiibacteriota bacterium]|nr:MAG: T9SS type A sorting domain-containing protein [candidate division Zixibacteria bacterium]